MSENGHDSRFIRNMNPIFKYDFKVGNYMTDEAKKMNPHLFMTIKDITTGLRKSSWFTSADFSNMVQANIASHLLYFTTPISSNPNAKQLTALSSDLDGTFTPNT
jgi:hypothetical protein